MSDRESYGLRFDHIAVPVGNTRQDLIRFLEIFKLLGFEREWYRKFIGNEETGMSTAVMTRGEVKFAFMAGIDGQSTKGKHIISQVNLYFHKFGICPQHIAIRCETLEYFENLIANWYKNGVRFITETKDHQPLILRDKGREGVVLQCFTYPIEKSWFFEIKYVGRDPGAHSTKFKEFRDDNVRGLWASVDRMAKSGILFSTNLFGEITKRAKRKGASQKRKTISRLVNKKTKRSGL